VVTEGYGAEPITAPIAVPPLPPSSPCSPLPWSTRIATAGGYETLQQQTKDKKDKIVLRTDATLSAERRRHEVAEQQRGVELPNMVGFEQPQAASLGNVGRPREVQQQRMAGVPLLVSAAGRYTTQSPYSEYGGRDFDRVLAKPQPFERLTTLATI
jgi:hypothetical protein